MADEQDLMTTATEESKDTLEQVESWPEEHAQETNSFEAASAVLSSPEAAPSVTVDRKNELLLQARADRVAWIQAVPLPYQTSGPLDSNDPWSQDDRLALLKASNAIQSLPSIPELLSSLYGMEKSTSTEIADRIQALLEPMGMSQEDCELATTSSRKESLMAELSNARTKHEQSLLESYRAFLIKLQTPECATLVQGMRRFVRTLPDTQETMASSLRSYLTSTFESIKSHGPWSNVDDGVRHSLESFLYGHCKDRIQSVLSVEAQEDADFLDRLESLQFVTPTHLEIPCLVEEQVDELLQEAMDALLSVDSYFSPYEKLQKILNVYHSVNSALSKALNKDGSQRLPSADDVLPTLILTVLRSKPPHVVSTLRMIEVFCPPEYLRGEAGYAYTNLYGTFQFLRDMNLEEPDSLSINREEFRRGLDESRASAKARLAQVVANEEKEQIVTEKPAPEFPVKIPVRDIRAARLRGETIDLEWARRWQTEHGVVSKAGVAEVPADRTDGLPNSLPSGFSRSYSFMATRPEDVRISELPQLLAEYRMLVHATEQLIAERAARLSLERKQKLKATRAALLASAAKVDLLPTGKSKS